MACSFDKIVAYAAFPSREWAEEDFSLGYCFPWPLISFDDWTAIAKSNIRSIDSDQASYWVALSPLLALVLNLVSYLRFLPSSRAAPGQFYSFMLAAIIVEVVYGLIFFWNYFWKNPLTFKLGFCIQVVVLCFNLYLDTWVSLLAFIRFIYHCSTGLAWWKGLCVYVCIFLCHLAISADLGGLDLRLDPENHDRMESFKNFLTFSNVCQYLAALFFVLCVAAKMIFGDKNVPLTRRLQPPRELVMLNVSMYLMITTVLFNFDWIELKVDFVHLKGGIQTLSRVSMGSSLSMGLWLTSVVSLMRKSLSFYFMHLIGYMLKMEFRRFLCKFDFDCTKYLLDLDEVDAVEDELGEVEHEDDLVEGEGESEGEGADEDDDEDEPGCTCC